METLDELIAELAVEPRAGYGVCDVAATEPTALVTLALMMTGRFESAAVGLEWLSAQQADDGSVGVRAGEPTPRWPTSLAVLAWQAAVDSGRAAWLSSGDQVSRAVDWILSNEGKKMPPLPPPAHDTQIVAWPWVEGTHSWIEPTALHLLALKSVGLTAHPRAREAVRMLIDRQLPTGGCNYGNTFILGRKLRPHVLPTALAVLALADECDAAGAPHPRVAASIRWLRDALDERTTALSLCWSLIALDACGRRPDEADAWLAEAARRERSRDGSPFRLALIALAGLRWQPARVSDQGASRRISSVPVAPFANLQNVSQITSL